MQLKTRINDFDRIKNGFDTWGFFSGVYTRWINNGLTVYSKY